MRRAFTLIELLVVLAILAILCALLPGAMEIPFQVFFGFLPFLARNLREIGVDPAALATFLVCLAALTWGLQSFGRWWLASRNPCEGPPASPPTWRFRWTAGFLAVVILMFAAGIAVVGFVHQTVWLATSPEPLLSRTSIASKRIRSMNHLKQLGIGAYGWHDQEKSFPPGTVLDERGNALHGWPTLLLPYLEQNELFKRIDRTRPWNEAGNAKAARSEVDIFLNPALEPRKDQEGYGLIHYAGNQHLLNQRSLKSADISDGTGQTILMGEIGSDFQPWASPFHTRDPALGLDRSPRGFGSPPDRNPPGIAFVMADGSVRMFQPDIDPAVLRALATPRGGEPLRDAEVD